MDYGHIVLPGHPITVGGDYLILSHADLAATDFIDVDGEPLFAGDHFHRRGSVALHGPGLVLAYMTIDEHELAPAYR